MADFLDCEALSTSQTRSRQSLGKSRETQMFWNEYIHSTFRSLGLLTNPPLQHQAERQQREQTRREGFASEQRLQKNFATLNKVGTGEKAKGSSLAERAKYQFEADSEGMRFPGIISLSEGAMRRFTLEMCLTMVLPFNRGKLIRRRSQMRN